MSAGLTPTLVEPEHPSKECVHCGEPIVWTRRLASSWENVLYCSAVCRRAAVSEQRAQRAAKWSAPGLDHARSAAA